MTLSLNGDKMKTAISMKSTVEKIISKVCVIKELHLSLCYNVWHTAFLGICDFKTSGGATGPSTCCDVCSQEARCKGFVFASGTCFYKVACKHTRTNFPLPGGFSAYER